MAIRLYAFGGQAVTPSDIWVIDVDRSGTGRPKVRGEWRFSSYDEAVEFTRLRPPGQFRIASKNPLISPVPLERLEAFTSVFRSLGRQDAPGSQPDPSAVQVFEYASLTGR